MKNIYKNTFGLQISNEFLKAVELSNGKSDLKLKNYSLAPLSPEIVEDNCIVINKEAFKEAVQKLMMEANNGPMTSKNVIISIPEEKTFSHHLEVPVEYSKDDEYIRKMAKDYIPIDLTEAVIDYKPIKEESDKDTVVFDFAAVQKMLVKPLIDILEEMGLNVIGIDISRNSILRCCNNRFQKNEGGYLVSYLDVDKFSISVSTPLGHSYSLSIPPEELHITEKMKRILNTKNADELFSVMNEYKQDEKSLQPEKQKNLHEELGEELNIIIKKTKELIKAIKNQEGFNLKNIYLLGRYSSIPGLKEEYQANFPEAEIKTKLDYIDINGMSEMIFSETIGLALRSALCEENEKDVNLLPQEKKDEIEIVKKTPVILMYSLWTCIAMVVGLLFTGTMVTDNYLNYKITKQEADLYTEKTSNPYLAQMAQASQQKIQLERAIVVTLEDIIPVSRIIGKIDDFNMNKIGLLNMSYMTNKDNQQEMRLRAKVSNRDLTEQFVMELEKIPYFSKIDSPLSNLVGKGERFVNINLLIDPKAVVSDYQQQTTEEIGDLRPKMPAAENDVNENESAEEIINQ